MKGLIIALTVILGIVTASYGEQRYNAMENRWETVPDNSDWQPKYNSMENEWSYQPPRAQTEYNAFENRWDWNSGHNPGSDD